MDPSRVVDDVYAPSEASTEPIPGETWMHLHDSYFRFMASRASEEQQGSASSSETTLRMGSTLWTLGREGTEARCNVCNSWMRIDDPKGELGPNPAMTIMYEHAMQPGHRKRVKAIRAQEENERLEALAQEQVQEKVQTIKSLIDEHPMHLKNEWIPLGNFLKISKIDLQNRSYKVQEFMVARDTDESKVLLEILNWLDEK